MASGVAVAVAILVGVAGGVGVEEGETSEVLETSEVCNGAGAQAASASKTNRKRDIFFMQCSFLAW